GFVEAWPAMQADIALIQLRIVGQQLRDVRVVCRSIAPQRSVEWLAEADVPPELEARARILRGRSTEGGEIDLPVEALDPRQPRYGNRLARRCVETSQRQVYVVLRPVRVGRRHEKCLCLWRQRLVTQGYGPRGGEQQQRDQDEAPKHDATPLEKEPDHRFHSSRRATVAAEGSNIVRHARAPRTPCRSPARRAARGRRRLARRGLGG